MITLAATKINCLFLLMLTSIALAGCATSSDSQTAAQSEQRKAALQSWYQCLHSELASTPTTSNHLSTGASRRTCQGHEFDVLATYPPHMEASINHLFAQSARRVMLQQNPQSVTARNLPELARAKPVNKGWNNTLRGDSLPRLNSVNKVSQ